MGGGHSKSSKSSSTAKNCLCAYNPGLHALKSTSPKCTYDNGYTQGYTSKPTNSKVNGIPCVSN